MLLSCNNLKAKPFVKWAGGKRQIVNILLSNVPKSFNRYFEPFVGGGALLFELKPKKAVISDINEELINAYRVIKGNVDELIESLKKHKNSADYYYSIRAINPKTLNPVERASRFIYLNKTCFNGLYRENSKGEFNVPFGKYKNPKICDEENLRAVSQFLNSIDIEIFNSDYKETCELTQPGDFIYFDPPYYPVSKTSSFTKYNSKDFSEEDQIELSQIFKELDKKGCYVMLSNSDTEFIRKLYEGYRIQVINTNRFINCKANKRKNASFELLITNF